MENSSSKPPFALGLWEFIIHTGEGQFPLAGFFYDRTLGSNCVENNAIEET